VLLAQITNVDTHIMKERTEGLTERIVQDRPGVTSPFAGHRVRIINIIGWITNSHVRQPRHPFLEIAGLVGILSRTLAMAMELTSPAQTRVNAIALGLMDTAQTRYGTTEVELMARAAAIPLGRMGRPEDIFNAAVFLTSE
jgi:NAD(P)-dependent dehydrogenase (short-subunit alcohol dehydrogenase family)